MRIILILILFISCNKNIKHPDEKINQEEVITMSAISNYDSIANSVKTKGDTLAYSELFYHLKDSDEISRTDTLMYYSKIMAEKFHNEGAYIDYFQALCEKNDIEVDFSNYSSINISLLDKSSKQKAENWLKKMVNKKIISEEQYNSIKK